jgi:ribosomal protein L7/L12
MPNEGDKYRVVFEGAAKKDVALVNKLVANLQNHCHLTSQVVTKMMRLAPITVKNGVDLHEAQRYQRALEGMGARVRIELINETSAHAAKQTW